MSPAPLARMTRREGSLSLSQMISSRRKPASRAAGSISPKARIAYPRRRFHVALSRRRLALPRGDWLLPGRELNEGVLATQHIECAQDSIGQCRVRRARRPACLLFRIPEDRRAYE